MLTKAIRDPLTNIEGIIEQIPAPPIRHLVFEGGGVRGVSYAGVAEILCKLKFLPDIQCVGGSSSGAITALLIALGYSEQDVLSILKSLNFKEFLESEKPWWLTPAFILKGKQYYTIVTADGHSLSSGRKLKEWLETKIEEKLGNKQATFADLAKRVQAQPEGTFKYLYVTGSNLSKNRGEVFSHETSPNETLADATRASAAFPGFLKAHTLNVGVCTDGGVINNTPGSIFNDRKFLPPGYDFTEKGSNPAVLVVKVDTQEEMMQLLWTSGEAKVLRGITEYTKALVDAMQSRDKELYDQFSTNIIQVYDEGIESLKLDLTPKENQKLVDSGRSAALVWALNHVSECVSIKKFTSEQSWLESKSVEEIAVIRGYYLSMRENEKDASKVIALTEKINWLEEYYFFRAKQRLDPSLTCHLAFTSHIEIQYARPRAEVDNYIKLETKSKLAWLNRQIVGLKNKLNDYAQKLENTVLAQLHDAMIYDQITISTGIEEKIKSFERVRHHAELAINLPLSQVFKPTPPEYHIFKQELAEMNNKQLYPLVANMHKHFFSGEVNCQTEDGINLLLDLKSLADLKLYVLAGQIYLSFSQTNSDFQKKLNVIYEALFGAKTIPKSLSALQDFLKLTKNETYTAAYRIEKLIKYFYKVDQPTVDAGLLAYITLDHLFSALITKNTAKIRPPKQKFNFFEDLEDSKKKVEAIEMDFVYHPFSCSDLFSIFKQTNRGLHPSLALTQSDPQHQAQKGPKCMRRL